MIPYDLHLRLDYELIFDDSLNRALTVHRGRAPGALYAPFEQDFLYGWHSSSYREAPWENFPDESFDIPDARALSAFAVPYDEALALFASRALPILLRAGGQVHSTLLLDLYCSDLTKVGSYGDPAGLEGEIWHAELILCWPDRPSPLRWTRDAGGEIQMFLNPPESLADAAGLHARLSEWERARRGEAEALLADCLGASF